LMLKKRRLFMLLALGETRVLAAGEGDLAD